MWDYIQYQMNPVNIAMNLSDIEQELAFVGVVCDIHW